MPNALAVVDLGKTDFFLGIDWLHYHNPSIYWDQSTLTFNRCPKQCGYTPTYGLPDAEDKHVEERLEEGKHFFYIIRKNTYSPGSLEIPPKS